MGMTKVLKKAFITTIPVLLGYAAIGLAFGLMVTNAGYPWWLAPVMSILIYAGAGQYAVIPLFAVNAGFMEIAFITLLVNSRHIVYGLSLIDKFKNTGLLKPYLIFSLTDETYGLLTTVTVDENEDKNKLYFLISFFDHLYWILGGVIGAIAGSIIPFKLDGVEFALTALFVVLLLEQIKKCDSKIPLLISFISSAAAVVLVGRSNMLLISILLSIISISLMKKRFINDAA